MAKDTGGAAFPVIGLSNQNGQMVETVYQTGMSRRDYFAAHAPEVPDMQTFPIKQWKKEEVVELGDGTRGLRDVLHQESWAQRSARWAVEYADALLSERAK